MQHVLCRCHGCNRVSNGLGTHNHSKDRHKDSPVVYHFVFLDKSYELCTVLFRNQAQVVKKYILVRLWKHIKHSLKILP
ncbi:hypothetical protein BCEN4_740141 [Burkholderia cenocepacia]|nr:hypothetical protein BCEN4_740141 [Burkholderia cenocepacia]